MINKICIGEYYLLSSFESNINIYLDMYDFVRGASKEKTNVGSFDSL